MVAVLALLGPRLGAQKPLAVVPLVTLGSEDEERLRFGQLLGQHDIDGFLLRSASRLSAPAHDSLRSRFAFVAPEIRLVSNSDIPLSLNDGALYAGRGWNAVFSAGIDMRVGPVRLVFAPEVISEQNLAFQVIPYSQSANPPRTVWANPFHSLPESIDLPLRFGDDARHFADLGQSSLTVNVSHFALGVATENLWWGPGIRNAIVLSNNAAGFPHAFVRTSEPLKTRVGSFEFDGIVGQLKESGYFDQNSSNDKRTLNGVAFTWRPNGERGLQLGFSRLGIVGSTGNDQLFSFFGRWVFPAAGFEAYTEWARFEAPRSLRDFLEFPNHSQGYTLGLQWAHPVQGRGTFRLQAEASYLEPSTSYRLRPVITSYTSSAVPQGFTERGKVLGASIGPGSSSQWLAGDFFGARWRLGAFAGRTRWDNGVRFESFIPGDARQDISLFTGVRGSVVFRGVRALVAFTNTARLNYLYQAYLDDPVTGKTSGIDIGNRTLSLTFSLAGRD